MPAKDWRVNLEELAKTSGDEHVNGDRIYCGWNEATERVLIDRFIDEMGLRGLTNKFLNRIAAEEILEMGD